MAISDLDAEQLINRFCVPLNVGDRAAFRAAAESALAQLPCTGPGIAYRTLREVFRQYFHPRRPSKLTDGPPIGADDPRTGGRDRHRFRAV